jgi:hypothetical protein
MFVTFPIVCAPQRAQSTRQLPASTSDLWNGTRIAVSLNALRNTCLIRRLLPSEGKGSFPAPQRVGKRGGTMFGGLWGIRNFPSHGPQSLMAWGSALWGETYPRTCQHKLGITCPAMHKVSKYLLHLNRQPGSWHTTSGCPCHRHTADLLWGISFTKEPDICA